LSHEWYQNDSHVIVEVFAKQLNANDVQVTFGKRALAVNARLPSGSEYVLDLDPLGHAIVADDSSYRVLGTKIEIRLKKVEPGRKWSQLEGADDAVGSTMATTSKENRPSYPSSSQKHVDWDQLERDLEKSDKGAGAEQDKEGDPLSQLFQQIYADADEDTRRAMIKSFTESGGTSLSTNWEEVGAKRVEVVPPKGMEERKASARPRR
ncbi:SGS domain-containing protein, partial [Thamnocephalis sphaerospora]